MYSDFQESHSKFSLNIQLEGIKCAYTSIPLNLKSLHSDFPVPVPAIPCKHLQCSILREKVLLLYLSKTRDAIRNPSISNLIRWVAWTMGQMNHWPSVWCSKYYFFSWFLAEFFAKNTFNLFVYFFLNTKIKVKSFKCPKSIKSLKK